MGRVRVLNCLGGVRVGIVGGRREITYFGCHPAQGVVSICVSV